MASFTEEVDKTAKGVKSVSFADGEKTATNDSRANYYDKWDKFAKEEVEKAKTEEELETEEANKALGIDKTPKSEAEAKDKAKHEALKAAKKQWDQKKASEAAMKFDISGKDGVEMVLDSQALEGKPVILFKDNKNSKFKLSHTIAHRVIKVFVEGCESCVFDFEVELVTQHIETAHCTDCEINIKAPLATLQLDLCTKISVKYLKGHFKADGHTKIYHAGVRELKIETDKHEHVADYIEDGAVEEGEKTAEEMQFVTHLVEDRLKTEKVVRDRGNMPSTKDELVEKDQDERTQEREAELKKIGGNEAFKEGEYAQAAVFYTEAIEYAPKGKNEDGSLKSDVLHVCYANRAFCFQKLGHHEKAEEDARKCIEIEPNYVKGLFRLGLALHARKKYHEAIPILGKASKLQPKNDQIKQALGFAELKLRKAMQERS